MSIKKTKFLKFDSKEFLFKECINILKKYKKKNVILSGGKTFIPFLKKLSEDRKVKKNFILTDERLSNNKKKSNFYNLNKIINKNSNLKLNYNLDNICKNDSYISNFLSTHYRLKIQNADLAFLGVGEDGHVASFFKYNDLISNKKDFIVTQKHRENFKRVSISLKLLNNINLIIFVLYGNKKNYLIKKKMYNTIFYQFLKHIKSKVKVFYV